MKKNSSLKIPSSLILVTTLMFGNFLNFIFNAVLGRVLSFEEFGQLTLFTTLWAIIGVFLNAFGGTINHKVSYLFSRSKSKAEKFHSSLLTKAVIAGVSFTLLWGLLSSPISNYFNISDPSKVILFAPTILIGLLIASGKGYLQGTLDFKKVALLSLIEPVAKLISTYALSLFGLSAWVYLSIPISIFVTLVAFSFLTNGKTIELATETKAEPFPLSFFSASILSGFSTYAFATFDVLLAKHFLSEIHAGEYALLSLVGKMVFFFGSILNGFVITYVSREAGLEKKTKSIFSILLGGSIFLTISSFVALGPLGNIFVPFLLGSKAAAIVPYLTTYTLGTALFTIANVLVVYHLAKRQYLFSVISVIMSVVMIIGILITHTDVMAIANVFLFVAFLQFVIISLLHFIYDYGKYAVRNIIDLIDVFAPLPKGKPLSEGKKKILIFNWRDTRHVHAGGAEIYVHEIAKRWVLDGNRVTLFCGNDSNSKRYEIVDGVEVIRRGGFHTVYPWAFLYYFLQFRGQYDVIIDCQNGVPFFTPLYAREPVYAVVYHVHQKVFSQFLDKTSAFVASNIEKHIMPRAYKHAHFITISESTKKEMEDLNIIGEGIQIVYCGVDIESLFPGTKSTKPTVLCLGRLKAYKSVDVVIKAFKTVLEKLPEATLIIAGSGEESDNLKKLTKELGIESNVTFKGKVTNQEKTRLLQEAWVFVNPSMMEGWGITTIEANACGTPVIAADVPGLRDSVNNPHTGYLVEYGKAEAFAEKIIYVLQNKKTRNRMETESIEWSKKFTWRASSDYFLKLI